MFRRKRKKIRVRIQPKFKYFLTPNETSLALGISPHTLARWKRKWIATGFQWGNGPAPVKFGPKSYRYRWNDVTNPPPGEDFLSRMKRELWESIEAEKHPTVSFPKTIRTASPVPSTRRNTPATPVQPQKVQTHV